MPTVLVVARGWEDRRRIADVLLVDDQLVFCACDVEEVLDFEFTGVSWSVIVFGGADGSAAATEYLRRSENVRPVVVVKAAANDGDDGAEDLSDDDFDSPNDAVSHLLALVHQRAYEA